MHDAVDGQGVPYHPIPVAKKLLCGMGGTAADDANAGKYISQHDSLSVVAQALLQNDYRVVEAGAGLLHRLMAHNPEASAKLYLTGIFYFALSFTGSNFGTIATLLDQTHLEQNFRSGFVATAGDGDLPLPDRSILGHLLPEGLLFVLVNYGPVRFAEVFVGDYDTPEVVWNFDMRKHLVEMIRQHIGEFPRRLRQNTTEKYEYCPMPGVQYRRLEKELFCHNYYLRNLCDETRYGNWPIEEPVEVFWACLENFKMEICRDEEREGDDQEESRKVLGLSTGDGGGELRKAYRMLARKYHPDKNPAGRDMFEKIKMAYDIFLPVVEAGGKITGAGHTDDHPTDDDDDDADDGSALGIVGGTGALNALGLLIQTQVLLCRRYPTEIGVYKYPAYALLLLVLKIPAGDGGACLMAPPRARFVYAAVELLFPTCLVSPLNAEELVAEGGVPVLARLLRHYVGVYEEGDRTFGARHRRPDEGMVLAIVTHKTKQVTQYRPK